MLHNLKPFRFILFIIFNEVKKEVALILYDYRLSVQAIQSYWYQRYHR